MAPRHFPRPESEQDERALDYVRHVGWHCVLVADEHHPEHAEANAALEPHPVYDAAFAYTVGVWRTWEHPELILVGRWQHAHDYLAALVEMVRGGERFAPGDTTTELLEGYEVRFGAVSDAHRLDLLTWADWLNLREPFAALQVVLPDRAGRWPEDPDYAGFPQPLLAP